MNRGRRMKKDTRSVLFSKVEDNEARKEREAICELEALGRKLDRKRSRNNPLSRGRYASSSR